MIPPRPQRKPKAKRPKDGGAALILVLWGAIVMSIIAAAAARQASTTALVVNTGAELVRAKALADGGLRAGWSAFADGRIDEFNTVWGCRAGGDLLLVRLRPESARIDINAATEGRLTALFIAAGAPPPLAERITAAAVAYRAFGAKSEDLATEDGSAPQPSAPGVFRPGAFQMVEELGYLEGMTPDLYRLIADDITVHSRTADVDVRDASPLVRRALEIEAQQTGVGENESGPTAANAEALGSILNVRAIAVTGAGAVTVRDAVIEGPLDGDAAPSFLVSEQAWLKADEALPDGSGAVSCALGFTALRRSAQTPAG